MVKRYILPSWYELIPAEEIKIRIYNIKKELRRLGRDAIFVQYFVDLFYLSGTRQKGGIYIPREGDPLLFIVRDIDRAAIESPIKTIIPWPVDGDIGKIVLEHYKELPMSMGIEEDILPYRNYRQLKDSFPETTFFNASSLIKRIRRIKTSYEISQLREAGKIGEKLYKKIPEFIKKSPTEISLAAKMVEYAMSLGHQNLLRVRSFNDEIYTWHIVSGINGTIGSYIEAPFGGLGLSPSFPVGASKKRLVSREPILIDFGTCFMGYQIDQTRMFSIGKPQDIVIDAYNALKEIERDLLFSLRPGIAAEKLYFMALNKAKEMGFADYFLGYGDNKIRFVGHGVGLEINEFPFLAPGHTYLLESGMVLALELKMVIPHVGAIGLENTILIKDDTPEVLSLADQNFIYV